MFLTSLSLGVVNITDDFIKNVERFFSEIENCFKIEAKNNKSAVKISDDRLHHRQKQQFTRDEAMVGEDYCGRSQSSIGTSPHALQISCRSPVGVSEFNSELGGNDNILISENLLSNNENKSQNNFFSPKARIERVKRLAGVDTIDQACK